MPVIVRHLNRVMSAKRLHNRMNRRLQDLAVLLYELPEWFVIKSLTVESAEGSQEVQLPLVPGESLPIPDGPFTLRIEAGPEHD